MNERVLVQVAATGLVGSPLDVPFELDDGAFDRLMPLVAEHRLVGALAAAVAGGSVRVSPGVRERIADAHESWCRNVLHVERTLIELADAFDAAGIPYRALKGAALAHGVYPDPSQRVYADVDLLVPGDHLDGAADVIQAVTGGSRTVPELRAGHDREFGKEITVRVGETEVDLHRTFVTGPIGLTIPLDELFASGDSIELGGRRIDVLAPLHQFVHTCINAAVGDRPIRLQSLRDVAMVIAQHDPEPAQVEATARRWRCLAAVQHAVRETYGVLGLESSPVSEWAAAARPASVDRLLLRSYLTSARSYTRPLAAVVVIPGVRPRLRYLAALVWPQREYLRARQWTRTDHARRALGRLRKAGR